jgi:hypothetical protein
VNLLGGDEGKPLAEIKAHLMPKHAERSGSRPIGFFNAIVENALE